MRFRLGFLWNQYQTNLGGNMGKKRKRKTAEECFVECLESLEKERSIKELEKEFLK